MKLKKGDQVKIMSGKDKGKTGTILTAMPTFEKILVENLNTVNKRMKPRKQGEVGQTLAVARPFPASRAQLICPSCKKPTRVGSRIEGTSRVRYCKKCKATI